MDYLFSRVEDAACRLASKDMHPLYRAFAEHLTKVSEALHEIEWELSGDTDMERSIKAINDVFADAKARELEVLIGDAKLLITELEKHTKS